ncbi:MAG TPA: hypothetical protein VMU01_09400 [Rhizomicrobium sp.]|nr:hypothetical protein [Rhizomicrobium sp.]
MKSLIIVLSALVLLLVAAAHAYLAYAGLAITVGKFAVPMLARWICVGVTGVLGLGLLFSRK